jgi:DNA polymerase-3 subunit gamma/tau
MSYLVLARKYRPRRFADVVGQEVVTRTLQGAIEEGRVGHAYLLCGPRGTGKTTTARIFAKALNCANGPATEACGTCERCIAADAGTEIDLIEIDAASHTGVDNVRDLRDQAAYMPLRARFKVYLIDEVHMLSKGAFNALLKTLEEPPAHVKFLFATTEPHKLPDTILSRCQVLKLSGLSEERIAGRLDEVFALEGVEAEAGVSAAIARRSRGGMRDALSLADQLLALVGERPTLEDLSRLSSSVDRASVGELARCIGACDRPAVLTALAALEGAESDVLGALMEYFRACMLAAFCGEESPLFDAPAELRGEMAALARSLGPDRLELIEARLGAGGAPAPRRPAAAPQAAQASTPSAQASPHASARRAVETSPSEPSPAELREAEAQARAEQPAAKRRSTAKFAGAVRSSTAEAWASFLDRLAERAGALAEVLGKSGKLVELGGGRATVRFDHLRQADRPLITDARNQKLCSRIMTEVMGEPTEVRLEDGSSVKPGESDPFTQTVAELFDGRYEDRG